MIALKGSTALVSIVSRCGSSIDACVRIQPIKSKQALCKPLILHLKQLYICNKMVHLSYEDRLHEFIW